MSGSSSLPGTAWCTCFTATARGAGSAPRCWQGRGVGAALLARVEARARRLGLRRLATEASITARPFFQARGFRVIAEQQVRRRCATFVNYRMEKSL